MSDATGSPPIIDLTPLGYGSGHPEAEACSEAIHRACLDSGFFVVVGHGLDNELDAAFAASKTFFSLPQEHKERVPRIDRYGFVPHSSQALDLSRASDATEYIDTGLAQEVPLPSIDGFEESVRAYQRAALKTAHTILQVIAIALGLDPEFFAVRMANPQCRMRFMHYPVTPLGSDGSLPILSTPHTDYGAITLLATDGMPGLEVRSASGSWIPVVAPARSLTVNLGDMLARWTNDLYRSTPHRVLGSPDHDRYSIPFFVNPDPATIVECLPSCVTSDRPSQYEPIAAGEFLASRIDSSAEPYVDPHEGQA